MADTFFASGLVPAPDAVVELVNTLTYEAWPRTEGERERLFGHFEFTSGPQVKLENDEALLQLNEVDTGLDGEVPASWSRYDHRFFGIAVFLYGVPEPADETAERGFDELRIQLTHLFGQPVRPWHDDELPSCIWEANGRTISIQLFNRRDSCVMLCIEDTDLAAMAEAEAISS